MIKLTNLTKKYDKKLAVNNLNLTIDEGKIIGFIGPNGAGKTTTLKMLTGILKPTEGEIQLNGIDIAKNPIEAKRQFGLVFDNPDSFLQMKGIEFLDFIANIYQVSATDRNKRLIDLATTFELTEVLNDKIESYSHGMRQKLMVIGALIHQPSIWLLDEPLTGLDPQSAYKLKEMMREHASKGNTVLFSTHVLEVAEKLCDEIIIINQGNIKYHGTLANLQSEYPNQSLEDIFLKVISNE